MDHWQQVFETPSRPDKRDPPNINAEKWELAKPITMEEVMTVRKDASPSAPGIDGVTFEDLRGMLPENLACWLNLFLFLKRLPEALNRGSVTLIPKVKEPSLTGEY